MDNDRASIEKIIAGDTRAFKTIVTDHQKLVAHVVFKMVSNPSDQEEICQDVFVKVFENLKSFQFNSKLSTWIARIAYNTTLNYLQKKRVSLYDDLKKAEEDDSHETGTSEFSESAWSGAARLPDEETVVLETAQALKEAVDQLPAQYRTIVTLFHWDSMSYDEIGVIMDLPEGTVKSYLFRARKMLKEKLLKKYHSEELLS